MELLAPTLQAVGLFTVTNIDDVIVLSLFYARGAGVPGVVAEPGLVRSAVPAHQLAPSRSTKLRQIRWEDQFDLACRAFESNGFFVLIGDRQAEELDEEFSVALDTEITFVKLVPLVGG